MKKLDLGQTIGILANIGVIAGIVFLAIEVKSANDANRLQSAYASAEGFNQLNLMLASDSVLSRIFVVGMADPDRLNNVEAAQFANLMRAIVNQGSETWTQYRLGLIDDAQWQFSANQIAQILSTPGGQVYAKSNKANDDYLDALKPFMGRKMESNFSLGRDPARF
jgi:hypothetical protein